MRRKKVLFVSEAPWYSTGYSVYTNQVLQRLVHYPHLEFAQLAIYTDDHDPNIGKFPWKIYGNKPDKTHPNYSVYQSNPTAQFGDFSFNEVLLNFQPDIVMDIRDWWMIEFEQRSPFRDFFNWVIMPTVDAEPQANQWISTYESADGVFAYSEFGRDVLINQCDNIKFVDVASPAASNVFTNIEDKETHKEKHGLGADSLIIGTVMRNQKRKLYPDLFKSFREFLDRTDKNNVFLYCHTYYPDIGWDIPQLLNDYGLSNRVLFSYKCKKCGAISTDFFQDAMQYCKKCGSFTNQLVGISNSITESDLANIYNLFDIYVQYANSEGFGMPQLEAAYCGLPVISTYYSAMQSVIDNIGGIGIKPIGFSKECETGCNRAIPDNAAFIDLLLDLTSKPKQEITQLGKQIEDKARKHYTWDSVADKWLKYIESVELKDVNQTWLSQPRIFQPATQMPDNIQSITDKINFMFTHVLGKPDWIGGFFWRRVLRDCTFGYRCENVDQNFYFNESHIQSYNSNKPFSIDDAFKELQNFRTQLNRWEQERYERIKK
jgi:glycosyltransferase involved in cell wall biosynthesis